jgi:hypothetical protein
MTPQENKEFMNYFLEEVINRQNLNAANELVAKEVKAFLI